MTDKSVVQESQATIKDPVISVDRTSKSVACFDGIDLVREFESYTSEPAAIANAIKWFDDHGVDCPRIVYPRITKMRIS